MDNLEKVEETTEAQPEVESETVDPIGGEDVASSQGQSADGELETQAESEVESPDEETTEETETQNPWDKDERFKGKTSEEMYDIVSEADRYKGSLSQKAKFADELAAEFGLTTEKLAEIKAQRSQQMQQQQFEENPVGTLSQELQSVKAQLSTQAEEQKLDKFLDSKPEFADFREEIRDLGFSVAKDKTWDQIAEKYFAKAIVKGREAAYSKMDEKQRTQATDVGKGEMKKGRTLEDLSNMSADEMEKVLPHADTSDRLY